MIHSVKIHLEGQVGSNRGILKKIIKKAFEEVGYKVEELAAISAFNEYDLEVTVDTSKWVSLELRDKTASQTQKVVVV